MGALSFARNTFSRDKRLLSAKDFSSVFDAPSYKVARPHFLLLARKNGSEVARLGLVVGKKNCRRAVDRNRIKRVTRDSFRQHQQALSGLDIIFLARRGVDTMDRSAQSPAVTQAFRSLIKKYQSDH
ncbi:MAG: ribonuclease P protein component [bacterium]